MIRKYYIGGVAAILICLGIYITLYFRQKGPEWKYHYCTSQGFFVAVHFQQVTNAPPYIAGADGGKMFAMYCNEHDGLWRKACPHGYYTPGQSVGWQAVNLSSEQWEKVWLIWEREPGSGSLEDIPFVWCGRPTDTGRRHVMFTGKRAHKGGEGSDEWGYSYMEDVPEETLLQLVKKLNSLLRTIGDGNAVKLDL